MPSDPLQKPSFSPLKRWAIGFNVALIILIVFAVVVMVNYLSRSYFTRFYWSTHTKVELSPLTANFLKTMTNHVKVTLYYDRNESLFSTVWSLLKEYAGKNRRISLETVDYLRDAGAAQKTKAQYKLNFPGATNLVIFDCDDRVKVVDGNALAQYTLEAVPNAKDREFRKKPVAFQGERLFTGALLAVSNPKPLNAYFLGGHGEHIPEGNDETGYQKFADLIRANYVQPLRLSLTGTNEIPADANVLIIAGPRDTIPEIELEKIDHYLREGGRIFVMFDADSLNVETGLERILAKWEIGVGNRIVRDPEHSEGPENVIVSSFGTHPIVNSLYNSGLYLLRPRPVGKYTPAAPSAEAPHVENVAFTSDQAYLEGDPSKLLRVPLVSVAEKGAIKGVVSDRGSTRIVAVGDSFFLCNGTIDLLANRDFAGAAINWLLDRSTLLEGLGPRPVDLYRIVVTPRELARTEWFLLGGVPGVVLLAGGMVWFVRRR
jgi:hypothetical protein